MKFVFLPGMKKYLGVLLLLAIGIKIMHGWENVMDISFSDEAAYLQNGIHPISDIRLEWGPAYGLWYKILHLFVPDAVDLYYANFYVTSILLGMLWYVFLIRIKINPFAALLIAVSFLVSPVNLLLVPRIAHFVLMVILSGFILSTFIQKKTHQLLFLILVIFFCSYARPEFYLAFLMSLVYLAYTYLKHRKEISADKYLILFSVLLVLLVQVTIGKPDDHYAHYKRDAAAFIQHYLAMNKATLNLPADNVSSVWFETARDRFKDCYTFSDIVLNYPKIVFHHIIGNTIPFGISTAFIAVAILSPFSVLVSLKSALIASFLFFAGIAWLFFRKRKTIVQLYIPIFRENQLFLLLSVIISIPVSIGSFVVAPRLHYIFLFASWMVPLFAMLLHVLFTLYIKEKWQLYGALIFIALAVLFYPNIRKYKIFVFSITAQNNDFSNKLLISYLSERFPASDIRYLSAFDHVNGYLGKNFTEYTTLMDKDRDSLFTDLLIQKDINLILTPSLLHQNPDFIKDTSWHHFVRHYRDYGFDSVVIKHKTTSVDLFIKKSLLLSDTLDK